jgi:hypothetical protein
MGGAMQQLLKIHWWFGQEFIAFDEDKFESPLTTDERWKDSTEVTYTATGTLERRGKNRTLTLKYERSKQSQEVKKRPLGEIRYGVAVIKWKSGSTEGTAYWTDDEPDAEQDGEAKVSVLGGQTPKYRETKSVIVKARPEQARFRDALLALDKQCVLTGEKCRAALEAAHLVPVAREGYEQIENGILLRADVHSLLDAGLIWFVVSDTDATVKCRDDRSMASYRKLNRKRLPDKTFQRVKEALQQRAALPGGSG